MSVYVGQGTPTCRQLPLITSSGESAELHARKRHAVASVAGVLYFYAGVQGNTVMDDLWVVTREAQAEPTTPDAKIKGNAGVCVW